MPRNHTINHQTCQNVKGLFCWKCSQFVFCLKFHFFPKKRTNNLINCQLPGMKERQMKFVWASETYRKQIDDWVYPSSWWTKQEGKLLFIKALWIVRHEALQKQCVCGKSQMLAPRLLTQEKFQPRLAISVAAVAFQPKRLLDEIQTKIRPLSSEDVGCRYVETHQNFPRSPCLKFEANSLCNISETRLWREKKASRNSCFVARSLGKRYL